MALASALYTAIYTYIRTRTNKSFSTFLRTGGSHQVEERTAFGAFFLRTEPPSGSLRPAPFVKGEPPNSDPPICRVALRACTLKKRVVRRTTARKDPPVRKVAYDPASGNRRPYAKLLTDSNRSAVCYTPFCHGHHCVLRRAPASRVREWNERTAAQATP